jgi:hypothetical protein
MTKRKMKLPPISDADEAALQRKIASDPDDAEATDEELASARPLPRPCRGSPPP